MWWGLIIMAEGKGLGIQPGSDDGVAQGGAGQNEGRFEELLVSLELGLGSFQLFIATCDPDLQRREIVERYEGELGEGVVCLRGMLDREEPSLRQAIATALQGGEVKDGRDVVVTVMGAETLGGLVDDGGRLKRFWGYLQWTREGLREFGVPIVFWVPSRLMREMVRGAPDFWSWRDGVFAFEPVLAGVTPNQDGARGMIVGDRLTLADQESSGAVQFSVEELERSLEEAIAQFGERSKAVADLYRQLGTRYELQQTKESYQQAIHYFERALEIYRHLEQPIDMAGVLLDLGIDFDRLSQYSQGIAYFEESLAICREIGDRKGEAASRKWLGSASYSLGEYRRAIEYQEQSLAITREIGDRYGEGNSLIGLGNAYYSLGEYRRAIEFYEQSLAIRREISDRRGEASSLGNLGNASHSLGEYRRAIDFHEQQLAITREIGDRSGEANSLIGLGNTYYSLGEYRRAIDFHEQQLAITREIGDRKGEGISLGNLGSASHSLGEYRRAIDFHEQSLVIAREIGDRNGEANSLGNLGSAYRALGEYRRAIEYQEQSLAICREIGDRYGEAHTLHNLGFAWAKLERKWEAKDYLTAARDLYAELGLDHEIVGTEKLLKEVLQIIPAAESVIRAPQIGEPRQPEPWELERFDQPSPRPKPQKSRRRKPKTLPWWRRLLRTLKRLIHKLLNH